MFQKDIEFYLKMFVNVETLSLIFSKKKIIYKNK